MSILRSPAGRTRPEPEPIRPSANKPQAIPLGERWTPEILKISRLRDEAESQLVTRIHARLAASIGRSIDTASSESVRALINDQFPAALDEEKVSLSRTDRLRLQDAVLAEVVGYGPIQDVLADDNVSEVMVNGAKQVWVEREGKLYLTDITFSDDDHVLRVIQRIVAPLGRRCDESSPMVDARLPDGSRVNSIIPPLSLIGPTLTIRKFRRVPLGPQELLANGTITQQGLQFLRACVQGRLNIVVAGGTGAGKTTLLNSLSSYISARERIVTIEDAAEVRLQQTHVISLETRPANVEGRGEISIRDLFRNALRMRPDRIVIGECRGAEALDMLQAMNTGHDGSLTTIHANGPRDALARMETMAMMANVNLPEKAVRRQIASAVALVIQIARFNDGTRRVTHLTEITGMEDDVVSMQDVFVFEKHGVGQDGRVLGTFTPTGIRPKFAEKLKASGISVPASMFEHSMKV